MSSLSLLSACLLPADFRGPDVEALDAVSNAESALETSAVDTRTDTSADAREGSLADVVRTDASDAAAELATVDAPSSDSPLDAVLLDSADVAQDSEVSLGSDVQDVLTVPDVVADVAVDAALVPAVGCSGTRMTAAVDCATGFAAREDFREGCLSSQLWELASSGNVSVNASGFARFAGNGRLVSLRSFDPDRGLVHASVVWRAGVAETSRSLRMRSSPTGETGIACTVRNRSDLGASGWALCTETSSAASECQPLDRELAEASLLRLDMHDDGAEFTCTLLAVGGVSAGMVVRATRRSDVRNPSGRIRLESSVAPTVSPTLASDFDDVVLEQGIPRPSNDYDLNEPEGNSLWDSVAGATGTLRGAGSSRAEQGVFGRALEFDGAESSTSVPASVLNFGSQNFTISFWFKQRPSTLAPLYSLLTTRSDGPGVNPFLGISQRTSLHPTGPNQLFLELHSRVPDYYVAAGRVEPTPFDTWTHIALVRTGLSSVFWFNGNPAAFSNTGLTEPIPFPNTSPVRLGSSAGNTTAYLNGQVDELRVWRTALDGCQVRTLAARP